MPAERLEAALELLAEIVHRPTFPAREVERLRDERLNDLLQAKADPRRRADEAFTRTIYTSDTPYHRPGGGTEETVATPDRDAVVAAYQAALRPVPRDVHRRGRVCAGSTSSGIAARLFGDWRPLALGRAHPTDRRPLGARRAAGSG